MIFVWLLLKQSVGVYMGWIENLKLKLTRISFDISTPSIECRQEVHFFYKDFQHFWFQNVIQNALKSISKLSTGSLVLKIYQRILKIYCQTQTSFTKCLAGTVHDYLCSQIQSH